MCSRQLSLRATTPEFVSWSQGAAATDPTCNYQSPCAYSPGSTAREASAVRGPGSTAREEPPSLQLEKVCT